MKSEILEVKQLTAVVSFWNEKYTLIKRWSEAESFTIFENHVYRH